MKYLGAVNYDKAQSSAGIVTYTGVENPCKIENIAN